MLVHHTVTVPQAAARWEIIRHAGIIRTALGGSFTTDASLASALRSARELERAARELAAHLEAQSHD
jgi:hypothetical protein